MTEKIKLVCESDDHVNANTNKLPHTMMWKIHESRKHNRLREIYLLGLLNEALGNVIFIGCLNAG